MSDNSLVSADPSDQPRLLDRVRDRLRVKHYSPRTDTAYLGWIKRYILFHGKRHPDTMGKDEAEAFLTSLAVTRNVSAATQNQALSALLFLYREVLGSELPWLDDVTRAKKPARLPTVLTREEAAALLGCIGDAQMHLVVRLLYDRGMRLLECLRLRVKDVELSRREIVVRDGKGGKNRVTMVAQQLVAPLHAQLANVRVIHQADLLRGGSDVWLPEALAVKYPKAARTSAGSTCFRRRDYPPTRARMAAPRCPFLATQRVTSHVRQHAATMELLQAGADHAPIALWPGHESVETTQIHLDANLAIKDQILAKVAALDVTFVRYRPNDPLLAFLGELQEKKHMNHADNPAANRATPAAPTPARWRSAPARWAVPAHARRR